MKNSLLFYLIILFIFSCTEKAIVDTDANSSVTIVSPNGGEVFYSDDSNFPVVWSQKGIEKIDILCSIDYLNNWTVIVESIDANLKEYLCKIPSIIADSVRLRIRDTKNINVFDDSDGFFSIKQEYPYKLGKVKILTPTAETILKGNDKYLITWSNGELVDNIDLHYSLDNGDNWNKIVSYEKNSFGSYEWLVPNKNTQSAKIKLTVRAGIEMRVIDSEGVFKIKKQERDENVLAYFPLNIGDIRIYNREVFDMWNPEGSEFYIVKQVVQKDTIINNNKYFTIESESINIQTNAISKRINFSRVDTLSKIVYSFSTYLNKDRLMINLELLPNEVYEIDSERYVTLTQQDTVPIFDRYISSKVFSRRDIYGYTRHDFQLVENIGTYMDFYSAEGNYTKDILKGAVIDGVVYGDTTFTN